MKDDLITSWNQVPVILDLPFAAELLGLSYDCLKKKSQKGQFPAFKIGEHSWRVRKDELLSWIDQQKMHTGLRGDPA